MNDLYLTTYNPTSIDLDLDAVECEVCEEELPADAIIVVETSDGIGEPMCSPCAERTAEAFIGIVHDRREDPEELLREIRSCLNEPGAAALVRSFIPRLAIR